MKHQAWPIGRSRSKWGAKATAFLGLSVGKLRQAGYIVRESKWVRTDSFQ
jgi:hypothetical protein